MFDKLSKSVYKKYQSSRAFKELIKPISNNIDRTESFRLKREDGVKKE